MRLKKYPLQSLSKARVHTYKCINIVDLINNGNSKCFTWKGFKKNIIKEKRTIISKTKKKYKIDLKCAKNKKEEKTRMHK